MPGDRLISKLRKAGVWGVGQRIHGRLSPPTCALIHWVVMKLGPDIVPLDLWLKHVYDYRTIFIDPELVKLAFKGVTWRVGASGLSMTQKLRRWRELGGGWKSARRHITRSLHGRFVARGDWDIRSEQLDVVPVVSQLFREGRAVQETDLYKSRLQRIQAGDLAWTKGARRREELDEQFEELIEAYEAIRTSGYRTQLELGRDGSDEIRVCIDREGRLCVFGGGVHRVSIAKILRLDRIPVTIKRVHDLWVHDWMQQVGTRDIRRAVEAGIGAFETERRV